MAEFNDTNGYDKEDSNDDSFFRKSVPTGESKRRPMPFDSRKGLMASMSSTFIKNFNRSNKSESISSK